MQLANHPKTHLTYCTNIHSGEHWDEVRNQLKKHVPELKKRIAPDKPFGIGLRLSAIAAEELLKGDRLIQLKDWLQREGLYVFTMNGFPYGSFHHQRVKDHVYQPDWQTDERLEYTLNLIKILSSLLPEGIDGGISTSPLSYKPWLSNSTEREEVFQTSSRKLAQAAHAMAQINEKQGRELHLDIEPEPDCLLENTRETVAFFTDWLYPKGSNYLVDKYGLSHAEAVEMLKTHIAVCYDTCHFAVEYEDPRHTIKQFREADIRIGKVQISAALKVALAGSEAHRKTILTQLKSFEESTYLHQVIARKSDGSLTHYPDLPEALPALAQSDAQEWRIHYHVPIFTDQFDALNTTQDEIIKSLEILLETDECNHFEIETYTWEVLPEELKVDITHSIEREYRWALNCINEINTV